MDANTPAHEMGGIAFDELLNWARRHPVREPLSNLPWENVPSNSLDQNTFTRALAGLQVWPPEMSKEDHSEVFLALTVPNSVAVKGLRTGARAKDITKRMFQEGLTRVPYNVPDFPVPTYLIAEELTRANRNTSSVIGQVAQQIANVFASSQSGLDQVKDFFLCGLVSLEEIQIALPRLVPQSLVDEAIMKIIRESAGQFTRHEWDKLVTTVRMNPELHGDFQEPAPNERPDQPDLDSPPMRPDREPPLAPLTASPVPNVEPPGSWHEAEARSSPESQQTPPRRHRRADRQVSRHEHELQQTPPRFAERLATATAQHDGASSSHVGVEGDSSPEPPGAANVGRPLALGARTEPLPKREIPTDFPVQPVMGYEDPTSAYRGLAQDRVEVNINWNSTSMSQHAVGAPSGHQADEGAGTPQHGSDQPLVAEQVVQASSQLGGRQSLDGQDPVAWVSLEMQNECHGPYLSLAFQRCCQLYEARREPREASADQRGYGR